eukprot:scaffold3822_cov142-Isochrysis_galbana.AAC.9
MVRAPRRPATPRAKSGLPFSQPGRGSGELTSSLRGLKGMSTRRTSRGPIRPPRAPPRMR